MGLWREAGVVDVQIFSKCCVKCKNGKSSFNVTQIRIAETTMLIFCFQQNYAQRGRTTVCWLAVTATWATCGSASWQHCLPDFKAVINTMMNDVILLCFFVWLFDCNLWCAAVLARSPT